MFIAINHYCFPLTLRYRYRGQLVCEETSLLGGSRALLAGQGKAILVCPVNAKLLSDILGSLWHGFNTIHFFQLGIDKPPAHGGVFNLLAAAKSRFSLAHDKGRTGHAFYPTGND